MTVNELVSAIAKRAGELAEMKMNMLRSSYPETTETGSELIRLCREQRLSRADMVDHILLEEFSLEFDLELETDHAPA